MWPDCACRWGDRNVESAGWHGDSCQWPVHEGASCQHHAGGGQYEDLRFEPLYRQWRAQWVISCEVLLERWWTDTAVTDTKLTKIQKEHTASVFRDLKFYTLKMEAVCSSETTESSQYMHGVISHNNDICCVSFVIPPSSYYPSYFPFHLQRGSDWGRKNLYIEGHPPCYYQIKGKRRDMRHARIWKETHSDSWRKETAL
jgi:hypothetical protein